MSLIDARNLLDFPSGDNSSDTFINGRHWNLTALRQFNYGYYANQTFSNGSKCIIVFEPDNAAQPYTTTLLPNGTFINSTSCYSPINPIATRSKIGLFFTCFFGLSIIVTSINLRKHGRLFLPTEKRFHAVGRRWQWYWMFIVATCGIISGITSVDVDRYYLPEFPIIITNFFWFLMLPTTMCIIWESVRHWGSWQERQMIDPDPFRLRQDDHRAKVEFYLPLVFYFFVWMNFFMIIPRSWSALKHQRYPEQTLAVAKPMATDIRFKLAAFLLLGSWITIAFSLWHSIHNYRERNRGAINRIVGFLRYTPNRFIISLPLSLIMIGYEAACAFEFSISPLNLDPNLGFMYGLGWAPIALIFAVHEISGYLEPNEDKILIDQRRRRGAEIDGELGIVPKPHWWSRLNRDNQHTSIQDEIARNVKHVGGGSATARNLERSIEMGNMPVSKATDKEKPGANDEAVRSAARLLFPSRSGFQETQERFTDHPEPSRGRSLSGTIMEETRDRGHSGSTNNLSSIKPQQVRSMLDV